MNPQRTTPPACAGWISTYLALMGAAQVAWLHWADAEPRGVAAILCAAPTLLAAALAWGWDAATPLYRTRLLACGAVLPPLLLLWGQTQPVALPPVVTALHALLMLACHSAAVTAAMAHCGLQWPRPQLSWVTSLVLR